MSLIIWTNNASSLLASGILSTDTSVTVTAGQGALFPSPGAGQKAVATIEDTSGNLEIVTVTGRTTDTLVIVRAQEGTSARAFASGSRLELRVTAGVLAASLQKAGGDTLSGTTTVSGVLNLGSGGSIQGGEFTGAVRGSPGETDNQFLVPTGGGPPTIGASIVLTVANLASNMPSGTALCVTNMIVFWHGASNAIPAGWVICDGTHGTPDLRDQFIVGGGGSFASTGGSTNITTSSSSIGALSIAGYALLAGDLPTLTYNLWGASGQSTQASNWTLGSSSATVAGYQVAGGSFFDKNGGGQQLVQSVGTGGAGSGDANSHTHTVSGSSAHTHTFNMPPYTAMFAIMKS